jgi:dihydrofolate reductase
MSRLTVTAFVTLDGVMQAPGGPQEDDSGGFCFGGWVHAYADEDMGQTLAEWFAMADAFLLGRRTYEIFAAHWPRVLDPNDSIAEALNRLPKYVASSTLKDPLWAHTTVLEGNVVSAIRELKKMPGKELQVHGSCALIQTLLKHGLVDELRLMTFPVVLGMGKRLFGYGAAPSAMALTGTRLTGSGVVVQVYQPAGAVKLGSFVLS